MEQSSRAVVGPLERTVRRVAEAWRAWRRRRYWTAERQLENLRNMVQGDHRWLAHDKVADALTTRYLAALAPDWMSRVHACPDHFRREIGLEPQHGNEDQAWDRNAERLTREALGADVDRPINMQATSVDDL